MAKLVDCESGKPEINAATALPYHLRASDGRVFRVYSWQPCVKFATFKGEPLPVEINVVLRVERQGEPDETMELGQGG